MPYPIAMIPYAIAGPYKAAKVPKGCVFVYTPPRDSITALLKGKVWAAAVPVVSLAELGNQVDLLGDFGIVADCKCRSILFFSEKPINTLNESSRICLANQSVSSVKLLYLLLGYRNGFDRLPRVVGENEYANGELLIGDEALCRGIASHNPRLEDKFGARYPFVTDLAAEWNVIKKCTFVFARWVIRRDAPQAVRKVMHDWLEELRFRERELLLLSAEMESERLGIPRWEMQDNFRFLRLVLNEEDKRGQKFFLGEIKQAGLDSSSR